MRAAAPCFGTQQIIHVSILHLSNVKVLTTIELPTATMISVACEMACGRQRLSTSAGSRLIGILLRCMSTD